MRSLPNRSEWLRQAIVDAYEQEKEKETIGMGYASPNGLPGEKKVVDA